MLRAQIEIHNAFSLYQFWKGYIDMSQGQISQLKCASSEFYLLETCLPVPGHGFLTV